MGLAHGNSKRGADAALFAIDPLSVTFARARAAMMTFYLEALSIVGGDSEAKARNIASRPLDEDRSGGGLPCASDSGALTRKAARPHRRTTTKSVEVFSPASLRGPHGPAGSWCANQRKFDEAERHARVGDPRPPRSSRGILGRWRSRWSGHRTRWAEGGARYWRRARRPTRTT